MKKPRIVLDDPPFDSKCSVRPFYNGLRYDSKTETNYAVFMNFFQIPFVSQSDTGIVNMKQNNSSYIIDYEVYPHDNSKRFYIEVKPFKPSLHEEELCMNVAITKGVPVYLFYGNFGVPFSIGNDHPNGYSAISFTYENGIPKRDEGYAFVERNGEIVVGKLSCTTDFSFFTYKLKKAYDHVSKFKFEY